MKEQLIELFGEIWYERLKDYLSTKEFLNIAQQVSLIRKSKTVYPSADRIFRIFKELPFDKVRVVMLAMDPYHDGSASGRAFDNSEAFHPSPSLKNIHKEIEMEYPELTDRFIMPFGGMDKWDLGYLVQQGVFLYNSALTVEKGKAGSHLKLWEPFTARVIQELNKSTHLAWLLLGRDAQKFKPSLNPKHKIIEAPHPASESYSGGTSGFFGSGVFRRINFALEEYGQNEIQW